MMTLNAAPAGGASQSSVTIRNTGTQDLVLSEPTVNLDGAKIEVSEVKAGRVFRVDPQVTRR